MKNMLAIAVCILFELAMSVCFAQKKITILGSSTAEGQGAFPIDSSWVARLASSLRKNALDGLDTIVNNRAVGGYVTYKSLPTDYPVPPGRPAPDPNANITYVLNESLKPDIVIINYPTNDIVSDYNPKEMMDNLRLMFQQLTSNGIRCFITTSQPRNTASDQQRAILRQIVDSVQLNFGYYAINFWDDIATADGMIKPEVNADGTHVNNQGHRLLFQRVQAKNIFALVSGAPLPLRLKSWKATLENDAIKLSWTTATEEPTTLFIIERSAEGKDFHPLHQITGKGADADYSWMDLSPLNNKNFYRLKITESGKNWYSNVISVVNNKTQLISALYANASELQLKVAYKGLADLSIISYSGTTVKRQSLRLNNNINSITIPIMGLAPGSYFLRVATADGTTAVKSFSKLK